MTHSDAPASSAPSRPQAVHVTAPRSWPWRRAALLLAGAAQLITIAALLGPDPHPGDLGIAAQITRTGLFFVPALIVLFGAAVRLWAEQPGTAARQ